MKKSEYKTCDDLPLVLDSEMVCGRKKFEKGGDGGHDAVPTKKETARLLQQSGGTQRSENADSICKQSNREGFGAQKVFL